MDNKELLTFLAIAVSLILGVVNLFIMLKNRRNAIREHLYKEQMSFFIQLNKEFTEVSIMIDDLKINIPDNEDLTEEILHNMDEKSQEIYNLINQFDFIIPEEIYKSANKLNLEIDNFINTLTTLDKSQIEAVYYSYYNLYFNFIEDLREIMGVDKLSKENLKLYSNKNKLPRHYQISSPNNHNSTDAESKLKCRS